MNDGFWWICQGQRGLLLEEHWFYTTCCSFDKNLNLNGAPWSKMSLYCSWCRWLYAVIAFHSLQVWHESEAQSITINQHGVLLFRCLALSSPKRTALYTRKKALVSHAEWWPTKTSRERGNGFNALYLYIYRLLVYLYDNFACHLRVTVERLAELPYLRTLKVVLL